MSAQQLLYLRFIALLPPSDIDCLFVVLKAVGVFTPGG